MSEQRSADIAVTSGIANAIPLPYVARENCLILDVNHLTHGGWLSAGQEFFWGWGEPILGYLFVRSFPACIHLFYNLPGGEAKRQCIPIEYGPANFGIRPLFVCPNCGKGFYKLFFGSGKFGCRTCQRLKRPRSWYRTAARIEPDDLGRILRKAPENQETSHLLFWMGSISPQEMSQEMSGSIHTPCGIAALETPFVRPAAAARQEAMKVHPTRQPGWTGGRRPKNIMDYPCTCGAPDNLEGHSTTCPRGRIIYQRRRRNAAVMGEEKH